MMKIEELKPQQVEDILQIQGKYFDTQATKSIDFRIAQLEKLKAGIKKYEKNFLEALKRDLGKNEVEAYATEVGFVYKSITDTIKDIRKWTKPKKVRTPFYLLPAKSYVRYEPFGSVLIIGPYNYPFQLVIEPLTGVIAAGNCCVVKPSELSPNVSAVIKKMMDEIFNQNYICCVEGGVETNAALLNANFDYMFFTGSPIVGKIVMEAASKNLVPITLELGGKSPVIVDESANIKEAARRIMWGKTINAGQTCVAPDYVCVQESVKNELIKEMKLSIRKYFGDDIKESSSYGRIINGRHFKRITAMIEKDKEGIIYGGNYNENDKFIEPTIIEISNWNAACMSEEIFGPVLPIMTYKSIDKLIKEIKKQPKPLALYLFTQRKEVENKVLNQISSGGVCINDTITHVANTKLPFGGVGNAGLGSYHGKRSFITFSHEKGILKKSGRFNNSLAFPPYTQKQLKIIKLIFK